MRGLIRATAFLAVVTAPVVAQTGAVTGVVVAQVSGERLGFAIVGLEGTPRSTFASDSGEFAFHQLPGGPYKLTVRRLGYVPRDIIIAVRPDTVEHVRVELTRVAVSLAGVTVRAWPPCTSPGMPTADTALAAIIGQIKLNAEQFRFLATQYPFSYNALISRVVRYRKTGLTAHVPSVLARYESKTDARYKPGGVIHRRGSAHYFRIPTLIEVADPAFVRAHCWHFGGHETVEDEPVFRVDVVAFDSLAGADVNGSFFVSTGSFQIRRSILTLSRRPTQVKELLAMETTTDFFEVMPSISIVARVYSVQTMDPEKKSQLSETTEEHRTTGFNFLGRRPGDDQRPGAARLP